VTPTLSVWRSRKSSRQCSRTGKIDTVPLGDFQMVGTDLPDLSGSGIVLACLGHRF
jgi:hypothetical protein